MANHHRRKQMGHLYINSHVVVRSKLLEKDVFFFPWPHSITPSKVLAMYRGPNWTESNYWNVWSNIPPISHWIFHLNDRYSDTPSGMGLPMCVQSCSRWWCSPWFQYDVFKVIDALKKPVFQCFLQCITGWFEDVFPKLWVTNKIYKMFFSSFPHS